MGSLFYAIRPLSSWGTWEKSILGDFVARVRVMSKSGRILQRLVVVTSYSKVTRRYEALRLFVIQSRDRPTLELPTFRMPMSKPHVLGHPPVWLRNGTYREL
jgi:hypothetical protein